MLIDSHCHLDFPDFADDLDGVLARADAAGVTRMITISTRVRKFPLIAALAERSPRLACTIGTHPHNAGEEPDIGAEDLVRLARHPKVVGIGEAGLDYFYDKSPRAAQAAGFRAHCQAARETGLPVVVHARQADDDVAAILTEESGQGALRGVLHCFTGGEALARRGLDLGFYISFSGILTFRSAAELQAIAAWVPADRMLVETDAPYLAPGKYRGKRNEPAFVAETARFLAGLRGTDIETVADQTTANTLRLFSRLADATAP
jgi:TatD DNase family protein